MKFEIDHKTLVSALQRGGISNQTKEAIDPDKSRKQPLLSCVKLTADKDGLTIESSSAGLSAKSSLAKDKIKISETGTVCVEGPDWLGDIKRLILPHNISFEFDSEQKRVDETIPARAWVRATNAKGRESFAWSYDCYATKNFPKIVYGDNKPTIKINGADLKKAIRGVNFSVESEDFIQVFDNIVFCMTKKGLYIAGSDNRRGAIVKLDKAIQSTTEGKIVINAFLLNKTTSCFNGDEMINISIEDDNNHLVFANEDHSTLVRASMPSEESRQRYPEITKTMDNIMEVTVDIPDRQEFLQAMISLEHKADNGEFCVVAGKEEISIKFSDRHKPALVGCAKIAKGLQNGPIPLNIKFLLDILQQMEGTSMKLSFFAKEIRAVLQDSSEPNYFYLMQKAKPISPK